MSQIFFWEFKYFPDLCVDPCEVQAGAALAAVPRHEAAGVEAGADDLREARHLAQQQAQLRVRHVVQDGPRVGAPGQRNVYVVLLF